MDYMTPSGSRVKLAPPHDFSSGKDIAFDLIPNIDSILNNVHSVGGDGSYVQVNGNWVYQPPTNSYMFNNGGFTSQELSNGSQQVSRMANCNMPPNAPQPMQQQPGQQPQPQPMPMGNCMMGGQAPMQNVANSFNQPVWSRIG